eukprot:359935-Chlamydomonas_euryale.AAC.6
MAPCPNRHHLPHLRPAPQTPHLRAQALRLLPGHCQRCGQLLHARVLRLQLPLQRQHLVHARGARLCGRAAHLLGHRGHLRGAVDGAKQEHEGGGEAGVQTVSGKGVLSAGGCAIIQLDAACGGAGSDLIPPTSLSPPPVDPPTSHLARKRAQAPTCPLSCPTPRGPHLRPQVRVCALPISQLRRQLLRPRVRTPQLRCQARHLALKRRGRGRGCGGVACGMALV